MSNTRRIPEGRYNLMRGTGLATIAAFAMFGTQASAQEAAAQGAASDVTEVVIVGARQNLKSAQQLKRSAETVVDSITAEDMGSFPDKSVAEALQRVAGITVTRFAGTDDTSHFSAEPSGVLVRGLTQVRSEFNGRDTFTANSDRGLNWGDVSPELMAGVDTYKNQTAELIEGGIAGSINLRTRVPFDSRGRMMALSVDYSMGDIAKKWTPQVSGIWSDRWDTELGEFGLMANFAYSKVITASQGLQLERYIAFDVPAFGDGLKYLPGAVWARDNTYDRRRNGVALAAQWRSTDGKMLLTGQFNRSDYDNSWQERAVGAWLYDTHQKPTTYIERDATQFMVLEGTSPFEFDSKGNFIYGSPATFGGSWVGNDDAESALRAANAAGDPFLRACYGWAGCTGPSTRAPALQTQANFLKNKQYTQDASLNFKWNPIERLGLNFDLQYVTSEVKNYNASVTMRSWAELVIDARGDHPTLTFNDQDIDNINLSPGGLDNPNNYHYYSVTEHTEDSEGKQISARADLDYAFDNTWLNSLRAGIRYADRDQDIYWGAYNWANISNLWSNNADTFNVDKPVYDQDLYEKAAISSDFYGGGALNRNEFLFFNMDKLADRQQLAAGLGYPTLGFGGEPYYPSCSGIGHRATEVVEREYGCYKPGEILKVNETTNAGYVMLKFGGPDAYIGGIRVSGNIGVRYVETQDRTDGSTTYASPWTTEQQVCTRGVDGNNQPTATVGCVITPDELAFNDGAQFLTRSNAKHKNTLPSFNLKLDLNDQWVLRFAASRALSRPDIGFLKNYIQIQRVAPDLDNPNNERVTRNAQGEAIAYDFQYTVRQGNPYLKPMTADQFDVSLEHYFAEVGSFTATVFFKQFNDYVQFQRFTQDYTHNGVTREVEVGMPVNGDGAKIKGFELAYQRFFDFLPAPFDGLGIQANYTYVSNDGITNSNLVSASADGNTNTGGGGLNQDTDSINPNALEGVSPRAYNFVVMYEKEKISARVAYNWRSRFLVTAFDCCTAGPVWQDSTGYLDASLRYSVTNNLEIAIQGSNLLNSETVLKQQLNNQRHMAPNAWFKNDRRIQMGIRLKY
ncbi:MAG: TonB-dependent receptor [Asticcacaulis sp.]